MVKKQNTKEARKKIRARIRAKISGTAARPRLAVFRSANHIYAQLIDDTAGVTLAAASTPFLSLKSRTIRFNFPFQFTLK